MIKDLTVFALAHLGAFMVIRDLLETSGIRAIEDANGQTDETEANFAQPEGVYILPAEKCSYSEVLNYVMFGKALLLYAYDAVRSGSVSDKLKSVVAIASEQVTTQMGSFYPVTTEEGEPLVITLVDDYDNEVEMDEEGEVVTIEQ